MGWLPGALTPTLQEGIALLGARLPFREAAVLLAHFAHVTISPSTVRRVTEAAGLALVAGETARAERLERELPPSPPGPARQQVSVDGAMAPLVGGDWREVKTLAVGAVAPAPGGQGSGSVVDLSYFSRMTDAATFTRLATGELHRRGTERADDVAGVVDGALCCQGFLDHHCPGAGRILDFPHALQHLSAAAQAVFGAGRPAAQEWLTTQAHALRHGDPGDILRALDALPVAKAADPVLAARVRDDERAYCATRLAQLRSADFAAWGLPIGSGAVESANKLVVEARLKGAGMHWASANVDPMLARRGALCSLDWSTVWPAVIGERRRRARRSRPRPRPTAPTPQRTTTPAPRPVAPPLPRPKTIIDGRPTAAHPWKRSFPPASSATIPES